jgi:hypothetical protein
MPRCGSLTVNPERNVLGRIPMDAEVDFHVTQKVIESCFV